MKSFSFAHLNPFGRAKAADGDAQDDTTKPGATDDADQKDGEDGKDKPADGGDTTAGGQQAAAPGERERCAAIFAAPAAAGRVPLAAHLAFNTDLTVEAACAALEAAPITAAPAPTGNPLALAAMNAHANPAVGPATDTDSLSDDDKAAAAVLASMAAVGLIAKKDGSR